MYFLEYPRAAEGGTPNHHSIHPIAFEGIQGSLARGDVTVANDRDAHTRVLLHLADERPVCLTRVHLCSRTAMDGERLDARILELFCQRYNNLVTFVPAQASLGRDGYIDGLHHGACNFEHARHILQESGTGALAGHALHGTTEVDVEHIGVGALYYDLGRVAHGHGVLAINLDSHGALGLADGEFLQTFADKAHEGVGGHKFGIDHRRAQAAAQQTETDVGHVFHRSEKYGAGPQVEVSYLHITRDKGIRL